jgi:hypothetical protein
MALHFLAVAALLLFALASRAMRPEPSLASRLVAAAIVRSTHGA